MPSKIVFILFFKIFSLISLMANNPSANNPYLKALKSVSQGYESDFKELIEMVHDKHFLYQGEAEYINEMFEGILLEGLNILDLGSGYGAMDLYLAKNYCVNIVGIDSQAFMINESNKNLNKCRDDLKGEIFFQLMNNPTNLKVFASHTFDLLFSKESILHVPVKYKQGFFNEIYRVLKPGGQVVIIDWSHRSPKYSDATKKMFEMEGLGFNLITPTEYLQKMEKAGFINLSFKSLTDKYVNFFEDNIQHIQARADLIINRFGQETYDYFIERWCYQREAFSNAELMIGIFSGEK